MVEYVIAGDRTFACSDITTGIDPTTGNAEISFTIPNSEAPDFNEVYDHFVSIHTIQTAGEQVIDGKSTPVVHGTYPDVTMSLGGKCPKDDSVKIVMQIPSELERRLRALEKSQAELSADQVIQNNAIAEIGDILGGE